AKQLSMGASESSCEAAEIFMAKVLCGRSRRLTAAHCRREQFFRDIDFPRLAEMKPPITIKVSGPSDASQFDKFPQEHLPDPERLDLCDPTFEWLHYEVDGQARALDHGTNNNEDNNNNN
ncbi:unnamed protein product, partial [Polarella glacialis]